MIEEDIRQALNSVEDPEAGMGIVDLGLVYAICISEGAIRVDMTMTSPACPVAPLIVEESEEAIRAIAPRGTTVHVNLVWEPPWTPERMSAQARERFGW